MNDWYCNIWTPDEICIRERIVYLCDSASISKFYEFNDIYYVVRILLSVFRFLMFAVILEPKTMYLKFLISLNDISEIDCFAIGNK